MRFLLGLSLGVVACLLVAEGLFHFLPVNSGVRMGETSIEKPFSYYLPNQPYVYSFGWSMGTARSGVTNSLGFTNSPDSAEKGGILVVGDSFIESFMLDFSETVQGRLAEKLPNKVQAISASGNGLADSLQILKYFTPQKTQPAVAVLFIEPYDLSLLLEGNLHNNFIVTDEKNVSVIHSPYVESANKTFFLQSAFLRYLYYNLKLPDLVSTALMTVRGNAPQASGHTEDFSAKKALVLNYYFSQLNLLSAANGFRVAFLLDGDRKAIYSENREQAWNNEDRQLFIKLATEHGLDVVDMQPVFKRHWEEKRERMDFLPMDGHWNPVGHKLAADEIMKQLNIK